MAYGHGLQDNDKQHGKRIAHLDGVGQVSMELH